MQVHHHCYASVLVWVENCICGSMNFVLISSFRRCTYLEKFAGKWQGEEHGFLFIDFSLSKKKKFSLVAAGFVSVNFHCYFRWPLCSLTMLVGLINMSKCFCVIKCPLYYLVNVCIYVILKILFKILSSITEVKICNNILTHDFPQLYNSSNIWI